MIESARESLNEGNNDWVVNIPNGEGGGKIDRLGTETDEHEDQAKSTITIEKRSKNETGSNGMVKSETNNNNLNEPRLEGPKKKGKDARNNLTQSNSSKIMVSYKTGNEVSSNSKTTNKQLQTDTRFEKSSYKSEALLFTPEPDRTALKFTGPLDHP